MPPQTTEAEFDALLRRAGLELTSIQKAGILDVFGAVEAMQARIRAPLPDAPAPEQARLDTAEPATTFQAERGR